MEYKRRIFSFLIVLAIISSAISPACAFIGGKNQSYIEICNGIGNKSIPDPNGQLDTAPDMTQNQCPFCVNAQTMNGIETSVNIIKDISFMSVYFGFTNEVALINAVKATHARAPPALSLI